MMIWYELLWQELTMLAKEKQDQAAAIEESEINNEIAELLIS